jgi:hypothetical protein
MPDGDCQEPAYSEGVRDTPMWNERLQLLIYFLTDLVQAYVHRIHRQESKELLCLHLNGFVM